MDNESSWIAAATRRFVEDHCTLSSTLLLLLINALLYHPHISVYIEAEVCGPGAKEKFEVDDKDFYNPEKSNLPQPVTEAFEDFMVSDANVLLLSGAAGSGKSTAYSKLQMWVLNEYTRQRKEKVSQSLPHHVNSRDPNGLVLGFCTLENQE